MLGLGRIGPKSCEQVPDGDGVSRPSSDVPAAVEPGRVLEGPTRTGDHTTGSPEELRAISARGWVGTQRDVGQPDRDLLVAPRLQLYLVLTI